MTLKSGCGRYGKAVRAIIARCLPLCAVILGTGLLGVMPLSASGKETLLQVASAGDISGKGVWGQCAPFARELFNRLSAHKADVHLVVYRWQNASGQSDIHAFVVFRDETGRRWGMDNEHRVPERVSGHTALGWSRSFSSAQTVTVREHYSSPSSTDKTSLGTPLSVATGTRYVLNPTLPPPGYRLLNELSGKTPPPPPTSLLAE